MKESKCEKLNELSNSLRKYIHNQGREFIPAEVPSFLVPSRKTNRATTYQSKNWIQQGEMQR